MNFIELTDRFGDTILVNFDEVEHVSSVLDKKVTYTKLQLKDYYLYVKESYIEVAKSIKRLQDVR